MYPDHPRAGRRAGARAAATCWPPGRNRVRALALARMRREVPADLLAPPIDHRRAMAWPRRHSLGFSSTSSSGRCDGFVMARSLVLTVLGLLALGAKAGPSSPSWGRCATAAAPVVVEPRRSRLRRAEAERVESSSASSHACATTWRAPRLDRGDGVRPAGPVARGSGVRAGRAAHRAGSRQPSRACARMGSPRPTPSWSRRAGAGRRPRGVVGLLRLARDGHRRELAAEAELVSAWPGRR